MAAAESNNSSAISDGFRGLNIGDVSNVCQTPGCGKPASFRCPTCSKLGRSDSYFCSQVIYLLYIFRTFSIYLVKLVSIKIFLVKTIL